MPWAKPLASPWPVCARAALVSARKTAGAAMDRSSIEKPRFQGRPGLQIDRLASRRARGLQRELTEQVERHLGALAQGLRGEAYRGIDRAEAVIVAPLHDFEEEPAIESARIGVKEFTRARAVVEDREAAHLFDAFRRQVVHGGQAVVIGFRDIEQRHF